MLKSYVPAEFKAIKLNDNQESSPTLEELFISNQGLASWVILHIFQLADPSADYGHLKIELKAEKASAVGLVLETFNDNNTRASKPLCKIAQRAGLDFFNRFIDTTSNKNIIDSIHSFIYSLNEQIFFDYLDGECVQNTLLVRNMFKPELNDKYSVIRELPSIAEVNAKQTQMNLGLCLAPEIDTIIASKSSDLRTFNRRLRLLSNNSINRGVVDEHAFVAAIFCCPETRKLFKEAMGISGHMQVPKSVHEFISSVKEDFQPFLYTCGSDESRSWFDVGQDDIDRIKFSADIEALYKSCVHKESEAVCFDHALIKANFNVSALPDSLNVIAKFVELNTKPLHNRFSNIQHVRSNLDKDIIGQQAGKNALINLFRESLIKDNTNQNSLLLYGSSGVGKTALAKQFAASLEKQGFLYDVNIFNMELMQNEKDSSSLFGSSHIYNAASIGELTSALEFNPNQIIVFDEIEKANKNVVQSLLTVLSERLATDRTTLRKVSFDQCFFIFTSNAGQHTCTEVGKDFIDVHSVLSEHFSSEFISRLKQGEIVYCSPLTSPDVKALVSKVTNNMRTNTKCFTFNDSLEKAMILFAGELAPRPMQAACSNIESRIWQAIEDKFRGLKDISGGMPKVEVNFSSDANISIEELIENLLGKSWSVNAETTAVSKVDSISVNIKISEPNVQYKQEDVALPFLTIAPKSGITFSDIIGNEDVKSELNKAINLLHQRIASKDSQIPECILLEGLPGSGKTHFARAFANAYNGTFIQVNASDLTIGDTEKNIKSLFEVARRYAPATIFIDEIDAIAPNRKTTVAIPRFAVLVNALLTAFDGFTRDADSPFIIAATNHLDALDPAIVRPGRLGKKLCVKLPTVEVVETVFQSFLECHNDSSVNEIDKELFGKMLVNTSIKGLEEILENALKLKVAQGCTLQQGVYKAVVEHELGKVREDAHTHDSSTKTTAYHEAGHAIAAHVIAEESPIFAVDILPRKHTAGCVLTQPLTFTREANRQMVDDYICIFLAGRAAEMILWNDINKLSIGASSDIALATKKARDAISIHGLSIKQTLLDYTQFDDISKELRHEVTVWLKSAEERALSILQKNWNKVEALAEALLVNKTMNVHEINALLDTVKVESSSLKNIA